MRATHTTQVEASYREYHKTAFTAATEHPAEAAQEAQRMRTVVCSLVGLRLPLPPTQEGGSGHGGGEQASRAEVDGTEEREAREQVERGEAEGGAEVHSVGVTVQVYTRLFVPFRNESCFYVVGVVPRMIALRPFVSRDIIYPCAVYPLRRSRKEVELHLARPKTAS